MQRRRTWTVFLLVTMILLSTGATALAVGDSSVEYIGEWYVEGEPALVAVDETSGDVFVNINNSYHILRYSSQGDLLGMFGREGEIPAGLAVDSEGFVVVAVNINNNYRIMWYDAYGQTLAQVEGEGEARGISADVEGHSIVAVNINNNYHLIQYLQTGEITREWDWQEGEAVAVAPDGSGSSVVAVNINNNYHIAHYGPDGVPRTSWEVVAGIIETNGITVGPNGMVFVAINNNFRIAMYSPEGEFLGEFGSEGTGPGQFLYPAGIAVTENGLLYLADAGNRRMQVFQVPIESLF